MGSIEFGDSYKAPPEETGKGPASESSTRKKGRTVAITTEDMQKRRNDVKARITLLLALLDEHQLRFSKYETAKELWEIKYEDITQIDEDDIEEMDIKWNMALLRAILLENAEHLEVKTEEREKATNKDWSYMVNEEENHALVDDDEVPTEFALMAKSSSSSDNEVYDDSYCSKSCRKNTKNINTKINKLNEELSDCETDLYNYKRGLSQVEARLVEFKENEVKYCERIRVLDRDVEIRDNKIQYLKNELEQIKKEKESLDNKLTGFKNASKDLDNLLGSQRSDKNKEGPPPHAQIYSPPKKDLSWTGLPEFVDDTITDYHRPTPSIDASKCNKSKLQSSNFVFLSIENQHVDNEETWPNDNYTHKSVTPRAILLKPGTTPIVVSRSNMNVAQPKMTSFAQTTHSNVKRSFQRKSAVKNQPRVLKVSTVTKKIPTIDSKFSTAKSTLTADLGDKGKAVKALACWIWRPKQNASEQGLNCNYVSVTFKKYQYIDTQGRLNSVMAWDSGCSRHMTGNISYLSEYEPYNRGYVSFRHGGGKITGKGIIKTGKLEFENVYFVKELKTPRQHNMYSIDLNIVPHKNLTCLVAKASVDESMLWHKRLGHLKFKTLNKLVRNNLVKGLPSKFFENDHTSIVCLKGKQHKASCKTKLVNSVFVTDDFSRFTWTYFLRTKDETSSILRNFITEIENLKDLKVKIISNAKTPQQNGVSERRNRTLIEAAKTMLADAKLPVTFWAEAVNTACYVQNRVLVNKSQNKTPYELFNSRIHAIGFLRPFGYHVMTLNTLDLLGKFDAKGDKGYFVGYSLSSKAFRVFNKRTKKVEENLHVDFLENKLIKKGAGPNWLFVIDTLTNSMNYVLVVVAGTSSTNISSTKDVASQAVKKDVSSLRYITLPNWFHEAHMETSNDTIRNSDAQNDSKKEQDCNAGVLENSGISNPTATSKVPSVDQVKPAISLTVEYDILTVSSHVPTVCLDISPESLSGLRLISKGVFSQKKDTIFRQCFDFVKQPPGFQDPEFPERVYKVEKAMYGLHQAPRACTKGEFLLVQVYVDDIIFGSSNLQLCREFEALMQDKFQMSAMGELTFFLGLQVLQKKDGIFLSQDKPDIMFAVCACAKHQVTPKDCHLYVVKRIFRYLKSHSKLGLWYPKESPFDLVAYSDSDYGGATQDRKSTTGGCQFLGRRLISWQCKKQTIVAISITKVEYVAAASGCGQVLWIQNQMLDYGLSKS
nr:hypothetical protein [Tanacetum cinerariifolium]